METSEATPNGGVRAEDLAEALRAPGPFLSVYLETTADVPNAGPLAEQRWRTLRGRLLDEGAPEEALAHVDRVVPDAHTRGACLAAFATTGGLTHAEHGDEPPVGERASWAPLPSFVPVIEWRQARPAHVLVLADRLGADMFGFRYGHPDIRLQAGGDDDPIRKVSPGGWSQRRFQQRAENTWADNAEEVAASIERLADAVGARLIAVAGDVRAVQLLREGLPERLAASLHEIRGGRSADGSRDEIAEEVARLVDIAGDQEVAELLKTFEQERGQADRAAQGAQDVLGALARSQVEILLVHDDPEDARTAWFGPDAAQVALREEDVLALGADRAEEARLADVCVRTALLTGARVAATREAGIRDGVGAILRWA